MGGLGKGLEVSPHSGQAEGQKGQPRSGFTHPSLAIESRVGLAGEGGGKG